MARNRRIGQRIRAAQAQAGVASVDELAAMPGRPDKFGSKTIGRVIRGERDLQPHEAEWLAKALHVDPDYFTEDNGTGQETQLDRIERRLTELETLLNRVFHHRSEQGNDIITRLDTIEAAITGRVGLVDERLLELGRAVVEGRVPEVPPDSPPSRTPQQAAATKRATNTRTT